MLEKKDFDRREAPECRLIEAEISAAVSAREVMIETVFSFYMGCVWSTRPSVEE